MSETKRKVYKAELKAKVGIEAIRGRKTTNELGQEAWMVEPTFRTKIRKTLIKLVFVFLQQKQKPFTINSLVRACGM